MTPKPYCWIPAANIAAQLSHDIHDRGLPSRSTSLSPTRYRRP
ncbi:hypothetical protein [Amycolatopsis alba]|nr:hypothetical protein [Amycolatopsis alba]